MSDEADGSTVAGKGTPREIRHRQRCAGERSGRRCCVRGCTSQPSHLPRPRSAQAASASSASPRGGCSSHVASVHGGPVSARHAGGHPGCGGLDTAVHCASRLPSATYGKKSDRCLFTIPGATSTTRMRLTRSLQSLKSASCHPCSGESPAAAAEASDGGSSRIYQRKQSRQQAARKPGSQESRQPGSQAARSPGSQAARQPGSQAARQPGSQAARQPGSQAVGLAAAMLVAWHGGLSPQA
jgi:hypothetical protein